MILFGQSISSIGSLCYPKDKKKVAEHVCIIDCSMRSLLRSEILDFIDLLLAVKNRCKLGTEFEE